MRNMPRETGGSSETDEGLRFEVRGFRNFEPRTSNIRIAPFAPISRFTRHSLFTLRLGQCPFRSGSFREPLYHG